MTQYSRDFSAETVGTDVAAPSGFTKVIHVGLGPLNIVTDATAIGGKRLELDVSGTNGGHAYVTFDTAGQSADMELLAQVLTEDLVTSAKQGAHQYLRASQTDTIYLAHRFEDLGEGIRFFFGRGSGSAYVGGYRTNTKTVASNEWWWMRQQVIGSAYKAKFWKPADQTQPTADEPASWDYELDLSGETDPPTGAGYAAFGCREGSGQTVALGFISVTDSPSTESAPAPTTDETDPTVTMSEIHGSGAAVSVHDATGYNATSNTLTVSGTAADEGGSGLALVEVRVNAGTWASATGTSTWSFDVALDALSAGEHTVDARATDGATNVSTLATRTFWYSPSGVWGAAVTPGDHFVPVDVQGYAP